MTNFAEDRIAEAMDLCNLPQALEIGWLVKWSTRSLLEKYVLMMADPEYSESAKTHFTDALVDFIDTRQDTLPKTPKPGLNQRVLDELDEYIHGVAADGFIDPKGAQELVQQMIMWQTGKSLEFKTVDDDQL